ncbi:hypothetical protein [Paraurantiacibacter namhicola]|uniref:Uncharacterized protein n=1 Tax=Paraurantiacibacter namhicola TaxID=645517 RepID=A0A1C7D8V1_9SPHN|nr:hypothetical protein [Paraurantiacibacter namhicola]ANU07723.1 hypothetical protein A6F65_01418 [Paraurantiacibacter namhicola]
MKKLTAIIAAGAFAAIATPAMADHHMEGEKKAKSDKWEVVETNSRGQATMVRNGDTTIAVCMKGKTDNCINPREAGLKWGNRPLAYWPGQPASSM